MFEIFEKVKSVKIIKFKNALKECKSFAVKVKSIIIQSTKMCAIFFSTAAQKF